MAIHIHPASPISSKKRDRPASAAADSVCQHEEYERALAFLQEFHARRMPTTLLPASLDAILESDGSGGLSLEDALVSDFSLTLSVSSSPAGSPASSAENLHSAGNGGPIDGPIPSFPSLKGLRRSPSRHRRPSVVGGGLRRRASSNWSVGSSKANRMSRMRRASASGCLSDLSGSSCSSLSSLGEENSGINANVSFDSGAIRRPAPSPLRPKQGAFPSKEDFCLGYSLSADLDDEDDRDDVSMPLTKRRRASGEDEELFF
ncbi:hypothetical protein ACHAWF_006035 [Thalassiosira exigua]